MAGTECVSVVLLVDDEPCVLSTLRAVLALAGYQVLCAGSPLAAIEIAQQRQEAIDLLVADVLMPGMSGPVMAQEIRRLHPESQILFIAGWPDSDEICRMVLSRDIPILAKPFLPKAFLAAVRDALARQPADRPAREKAIASAAC